MKSNKLAIAAAALVSGIASSAWAVDPAVTIPDSLQPGAFINKLLTDNAGFIVAGATVIVALTVMGYFRRGFGKKAGGIAR